MIIHFKVSRRMRNRSHEFVGMGINLDRAEKDIEWVFIRKLLIRIGAGIK